MLLYDDLLGSSSPRVRHPFLPVLRRDISGHVRQRILSSQASSDHIRVENGPIERGHHFLNKASTPCSNILHDSRGDMRTGNSKLLSLAGVTDIALSAPSTRKKKAIRGGIELEGIGRICTSTRKLAVPSDCRGAIFGVGAVDDPSDTHGRRENRR